MDAITPDLVPDDESAHTSGRRSARSPRVEVLVRADRRRSWSADQKRAIVAESLGPELTPADVARKYGISTGQLYTWRRQMVSLQSAASTSTLCTAPHFAAVDVSMLRPELPQAPEPPVLGGACAPVRPAGLIEIVLPDGVSLRVDADVDGRALRRVLGALSGR
jgi:transposase